MASRADAPLLSRLVSPFVCLAAGLALVFTPALIWRLKTGTWVYINQRETIFYLRFAARAYYNHPWYLTDSMVRGGATFYPWLQFIPPVLIMRALGLGIFSFTLIWNLWAAIGLSVGLYFVYRRFIGSRRIAAGFTVYSLSDYGLCTSHPLIAQLRIVASALLHPRGFANIPWALLLQWRIPNPSLDLPFLFLQVITLGRARERPTTANIWMSALSFGLLFYMYFYLWTLAAAGLCITFVLDRAGRRVYAAVLCIGSAIGLPQVAHSFYVKHLMSAEALRRFGLFAPTPRLAYMTVPYLSILLVVLAGLWIWKSGRFDLIYLWSLLAGGILLSRSQIVTGIFLHGYHWDWLWAPFRMILVLVIGFAILKPVLKTRPIVTVACATFVALFFLSGVYLATICVTRTPSGIALINNYQRYLAQRLRPNSVSLVPGSTIAGSENFCMLAAIAERQWPLSGFTIPRSLMIDDDEWEARTALNSYLLGIKKTQFKQLTKHLSDWFWEGQTLELATRAAFMRHYDEVARDPDRFIARFGVRYVVLPENGRRPAYLDTGWTLLQPGPYWQIWERKKGSLNSNPSTG